MIYDESSSEEEKEAKLKIQLPNYFKHTLIAYILLQLLFAYYGFGIVFFSVSLLCFIVWNTNTRRHGGMSAYSVFNKNFERIEGDVDPQALQQQLMRGGL